MILHRLPEGRYSEVIPEWAGLAAVLIGAGPSLTREDVALVAAAREAGKVRCIAINDAYLWAPWADVLYAADSHWHLWHTNGTPKPILGLTAEDVRHRFATFAGQKCSIMYSGANITDDAVHILLNKHGAGNRGNGLSLEPTKLVTGFHSGYQALNLAILAGSRTVILLGYDGRPAPDGRTHFSGGHPRPTPVAAYQEYRKAFSAGENEIKAAGVKVLNCTPNSAIDSFPKVDLRETLAGLPGSG